MSMTETQAPKKRGGFSDEARAKAMATRAANRAAKQQKAPPPAPQQNKSAEFAGLSKVNCCDGCEPTRCVISGIGVCAHPYKCGLQASQLSDRKALTRFNRAKELLGLK